MSLRRTTPSLLLLVLFAIMPLTGCSSFQRDWEEMAAEGTVYSGVEGRWDGTWLSDVNGHTGRLRCIITMDDEGVLQARYRAEYARILRFEYTMPMTVTRDGETYGFSAEADLGWLAGGRYTYAGSVVGDEFTSTFECSRDHGTFRMRRVQ